MAALYSVSGGLSALLRHSVAFDYTGRFCQKFACSRHVCVFVCVWGGTVWGDFVFPTTNKNKNTSCSKVETLS